MSNAEKIEAMQEYIEKFLTVIGMLWLCDSLDDETKIRMSKTTADGIRAMREALRLSQPPNSDHPVGGG